MQFRTELSNCFDQGNEPHIFELLESLIAQHQGNDSISAYFTKLKEIWDEIHELRPHIPFTFAIESDHFDFQNLEQVLPFLTGFNESFHVVHAQLLLIDPLPSLSKVFSFIAQEEHQRKLRPSHITNLIATSTSNPNLASSKKQKDEVHLFNCEKLGHLKDKCYFFMDFLRGMVTNGSLNLLLDHLRIKLLPLHPIVSIHENHSSIQKLIALPSQQI
ncbi:uncharacterized protein LOC133814218 [Humulus lupulus]|uniref:uncharacterized protein LOC133814218 n=1 Tax=Humulus lupulus TaxID=3486 RepID=UPI002B417375|nr:uncharacterized protein LOC133814218 [Humulus lupulus]